MTAAGPLLRRAALRLLALAPLGASGAAAAVNEALVKYKTPSMQDGPVMPGVSDKPFTFKNFADWYHSMGAEAIAEDAKYVNAFDPDIAGFRLPLATKVRMQIERNKIRIYKERKRYFDRKMQFRGVFEWWP